MDYFLFHGINTEFFQSAVQLIGKTTVSLPWKVGLKKNVKEKNYEVTLPPCKKPTEFFKLKYVFQDKTVLELNSHSCHKSLTTIFLNRFNIYAASRNIEDPSMAKLTPMIPEHKDPEQRFTKRDSESSKEYQVQC